MKPARVHHLIENHAGALIFGILFVSMLGGLGQIVPSLFDKSLSTPAKNVQPYKPLQLAGREIYLRESCGVCHTQQVRPLVAEVRRYGAYSRAGEFVYDRPFLWGSKRTGPDLHRLAGKYSDDWHRIHLRNPTSVVPHSIMPAYPWLDERKVDAVTLQHLMRSLRVVGVEYTPEDFLIAAQLRTTSEMSALIAYLQSLGVHAPSSSSPPSSP